MSARTHTLPLLLLFTACSPSDTKDSGSADTEDSVDTGSDTQDTGEDTQDTVDTDPANDLIFTDLSYRLHESQGAIAYVTWTQDLPGRVYVEYSVDPGEWMSSPARDLEAGTHEQILIGIPFASEASWRVRATIGGSEDGAPILTEPVPDGLPIADRLVAEPDSWLPEGRFLLTSINANPGGWTRGNYWTMIIDRKGRPVWASLAPEEHWTLFSQVSFTGDYILWDEATLWSDFDRGAGSTVHKTWLDQEFDQVSTPGLHHAFVHLPGDVLVWGSQYHDSNETLVELGPTDSEETILWGCDEDWRGSGRCESNGLFWNEPTDTFLYSFYTNNALVEVDHASGTSLWWAGMVPDGFEFDPEESQFQWQHGISYTDTGSLLVSTRVDSYGEVSVREYEVDHANDLLHEIWTYPSDVVVNTNGDAWRLSNGNTLHLLGSAGQIKEINPLGETVWHLDFNDEYLLGRGEFIEDPYTLVSPEAR